MTDSSSAARATERRIHVPIHLRWGDLDAYNHVNNTAMLKLLEEARVRSVWRSEEDEQDYDTAVIENDAGTLSLIASQQIEYLAPVPYQRAPLDVELWFGRLGGSSVEICYEVYSPQGRSPRVLYARCATTLVQVDAVSGRPVRLSETMRDAWAPYVGAPVEFSRR